MERQGKTISPLCLADWVRAGPWLVMFEAIYLVPNMLRQGGVSAKYIWDEHCVSHYLPAMWLARERFWAGGFPLWNPYAGMGSPQAANPVDDAFLPLSLLNYAFPFPSGLNLAIALKVMIALSGAFALARFIRASRPAALAGACLFAFSGFLSMNVNGGISAAFFLPWAVLCMGLLAGKPSFSIFALTALAYLLSLLGGNPQIALLGIVLGLAFYLFELFGKKEQPSLARAVITPGAALALATALSAIQTIPFIEHSTLIFTHHLPGFGQLRQDPRALIGAMCPFWDPAIMSMHLQGMGASVRDIVAARLEGQAGSAPVVPYPPEYIGITAAALTIAAISGARRLPRRALFFLAGAMVCLGVIFGAPPFSWLTYIPPWDRLSNWRFSAAPLALCVSQAAALYITSLEKTPAKTGKASAAAALATAVAVSACLLIGRAGLPLRSSFIVYPALATAALVVIASLALALGRGPRARFFIVLCLFELVMYDRVLDRPLFDHPHKALDLLARVKKSAGPDPAHRFIAMGGLAHPNLGTMLGMNDVRLYDAILPKEHVEWIMRANGWDRRDALVQYLTRYYLTLTPEALQGPAVDQAALRYLLSPGPMPPSTILEAARKHAVFTAPAPEYYKAISVDLAGNPTDALFLHAPARMDLDLPGKKSGKTSIGAMAALAPWAWDPDKGDSIQMIALGKEGDAIRLLYSRCLDPRGRAGEREWKAVRSEAADLSGLCLAALPGPAGDARSDFAIWADPHEPDRRAAFQRQWRARKMDGFYLYERRAPRPRLRLAGSGTGRIVRADYQAERVTARVDLAQKGAVELADTYHPGWRAYVGGVETAVQRAGENFMKVAAGPGEQTVSFVFEPRSFHVGLFASLASLAAFGLALLRARLSAKD